LQTINTSLHLQWIVKSISLHVLQRLCRSVNSKMGKLRQWFYKWFDRQVEKSMQRKANKLFMQHKRGQDDSI